MNGTPEIIKLAVFAVGGQGGGVLCNWIVTLRNVTATVPRQRLSLVLRSVPGHKLLR
ncbi:MAG: hypothetical protein Ct9H300mP14_16410 [Gammaproteobacteria bacterium]|nr:MAG: hypothetical protein Ct9H300mP14_16410 [Gammaproteobacteria bacterium]